MEAHRDCERVLLQASDAARTRDGHDVRRTIEQPGEGDLRGRVAGFARDLRDDFQQLQVTGEIVAREAWIVAPKIPGIEVLDASDRSGQETAAERAVGNHPDAEFFADRHDRRLQIARPQRILALQRRDRMHLFRAANGVRRRFGQAQMTHFAGLDQLGHRADGFFDGHAWIDAMLVIQIDMIDAEPLETGIAGQMYVLGCSIDADECAIGAAHMAELGGQHDFVAARP